MSDRAIYDALIKKLAAWSEEAGTYHSDRQLADEVLIADGWRVVPDATFEGGIRWEYGRNPVVSCSESFRPHPINDLNAAIAVVPHDAHWRLEATGSGGRAYVWPNTGSLPRLFRGRSRRPSIAILIAAFSYKKGMAV